ncbi:ribose-phosphate pyrophosphokinase [Sphingomonas nostoxanthinifaciens]|nr:ribose-phosphate pyrophosphokinase [Sphingomonas nostoxanthinifaciens]
MASEGPGAIADVERVRGLLIAAARSRRTVSYSELLGLLGHRFTRPKMRALCKTLDAVEATEDGDGLAVLVVREGDGLPGQGWWIAAAAQGYQGPWTGAGADAHVKALQERLFDRWRPSK